MSEKYDGPIFDETHTVGQQGAAVVPAHYLDVNQGRIMDMIPGYPSMAQDWDSVARDRNTGHRLIHTWDSVATTITREDIKKKPFIGKLIVDLGSTSYMGYIADYTRVQNLMYPSGDFRFDPQENNQWFDSWRNTRGTVPALASIMRKNGEVHFVGELTMIPAATEFVQSVDAAVKHGFKKHYPFFKRIFRMYNPAAPYGYDTFHEPDDIEAGRFYNHVSQKLH